jgi:hypothetical protein
MTDIKRQSSDMLDQNEPPGDHRPTPLPSEIQGQIGKQLRQVYGQILAEPLPDKFSLLLDQLSKTEKT